MPGSAAVSFHGFPSAPSAYLWLPHDGGPVAVADLLLAAGWPWNGDLGSLPQRFHRSHPTLRLRPEPVPAAGLTYRYEVHLLPRRSKPLWIACWRRYPRGIGWQRRCGPMPLERFLERFLFQRRRSFPETRARGRAEPMMP